MAQPFYLSAYKLKISQNVKEDAVKRSPKECLATKVEADAVSSLKELTSAWFVFGSPEIDV